MKPPSPPKKCDLVSLHIVSTKHITVNDPSNHHKKTRLKILYRTGLSHLWVQYYNKFGGPINT